MRKTSLYLTDQELDALRRLSASSGKPQAQIVREAIAEYTSAHAGPQPYRFIGMGKSDRPPGTSIADEEDPLAGFGEDD